MQGLLEPIDMPTMTRPRAMHLIREVLSDEDWKKLVKARHGDSSGVRGAAWLWP
jgi:fructokinase